MKILCYRYFKIIKTVPQHMLSSQQILQLFFVTQFKVLLGFQLVNTSLRIMKKEDQGRIFKEKLF